MSSSEPDRRRPPVRFASADGRAYWTAERFPDVAPADEVHGVAGDTIRFFPEVGGGLPLWDDDGLLDDDPAWLATHLHLEARLVADLIAWGDEGDRAGSRGDEDAGWREEGRRLVAEVRASLPPHLRLEDRWERPYRGRMRAQQIDERHVTQEGYGAHFVVYVYEGGGDGRSWSVDSHLLTDTFLPAALHWVREHLPTDACWSLGVVDHPTDPTSESELHISWIIGADVLNSDCSDQEERRLADEMLARRHRVTVVDDA